VALSSGGLQLEVVGREIAGRPVPGRPRRSLGPYLRGLPALALTSLILVPAAGTTVAAFSTPGGVGLGNFAVLGEPDARQAVRNSLVWVAVALGVAALGLGVALASRRVPWLWRVLSPVLVFPFAVAVLVSGLMFRLIFDPTRERGTITALVTRITGDSPVWLGPGLFWIVLVSAFAWTWLGYAASLFRAGLQAIPDDLTRTVSAEGVRTWRRLLTVELPLLRTITGVVTLTLVVAAVRMFDLVLIAVPGAMQDDADVLAVHWWRTADDTDASAGRAAALALVLFAVVAVVALLGVRGLRRSWAMPDRTTIEAPTPTVARPPRRLLGLAVAVPIGLLWAFPAVVLVATALHDPSTAGRHGWWHPSGFGPRSLVEASSAGLWQALATTALIAGTATVLVLAVGVLTAHLVAWGGLPPWLGRAAMTGFVVMAVMPVQLYARPLQHGFAAVGLAGSPLGLVLVHAAAGLPFAVLLLRAAFASVPPSLIAEALHGQAGQGWAIARVSRACRPALVAVAVLEFVLVWNDFIVGFLISGAASTPLSLVLWGEARQFATSAGPVAAAAVVSSVVPVLLLLVAWPTVVRGLTVGTRR
jgi:alpha-glucoside transport system permease protein